MEIAGQERPWCLPGCNRLDGHDGRDAGACMGWDVGVLTPGPLDLVHRHPDIPVPIPVRNVIAGVLLRAALDSVPSRPAWSPLLGLGDAPLDWPAGCYRLASGAMVHVRPGCRC